MQDVIFQKFRLFCDGMPQHALHWLVDPRVAEEKENGMVKQKKTIYLRGIPPLDDHCPTHEYLYFYVCLLIWDFKGTESILGVRKVPVFVVLGWNVSYT